jgi:hypothetical protein
MGKQNEHWVYCEKCGKKLIKRRENGVFVFKFGRNKDKTDVLVDIEILGSIKIKCFREENGKMCGHENIINFFPHQ